MASTSEAVEVVASAARTTTGNSGTLAVGTHAVSTINRVFLNLLVDVSAASGSSPTLDLTVEWSPDGGATFHAGDPADAFTQIATTTSLARQFSVKAPHYRIVWTIAGGTPSFTFSVDEYLTGAPA